MAKFGKELLVRSASGAGLFVAVVGTALWSPVAFAGLMCFISAGCMAEFLRLASAAGMGAARTYPIVVGAVAVPAAFAVAAGLLPVSIYGLMVPLVSCLFVAELFAASPHPFARTAVSVAGLVYIALPLSLSAFVAFRGGNYEPWPLLCCIFVVWVNDIMAYFTGSLFGRRKLCERISPNKSWEGFAGGVIGAVLFGLLCGWIREESLLWWGGLSLVVAVAGVAGDLVESMFKRAAGVKDAGRIIPGHGGLLDRFDALLVALPFVYAYFVIFVP